MEQPTVDKATMSYRPPSLEELLALCSEFELATTIRKIDGSYRLRCKDEDFDVRAEEAQLLAKGLLLGYFAFHTRDDLSLATWED